HLLEQAAHLLATCRPRVILESAPAFGGELLERMGHGTVTSEARMLLHKRRRPKRFAQPGGFKRSLDGSASCFLPCLPLAKETPYADGPYRDVSRPHPRAESGGG